MFLFKNSYTILTCFTGFENTTTITRLQTVFKVAQSMMRNSRKQKYK